MNGELISIRAIVSSGGGGGSGNATQLQGRDLSSATPDNNMCIAWVESNNTWQPSFPLNAYAAYLQQTPISTTAPSSGELLKFDGTNWAPFDGIAVPNWNSTTQYFAGDYVFYIGKIWKAALPVSGVAPNGIEGAWAELVGVSNGTPSSTASPASWRYINTEQGGFFIPLYL